MAVRPQIIEDLEEEGERAYGTGKRAPAHNRLVLSHLVGYEVGHPDVIEIMQAFTRGFDRAADRAAAAILADPSLAAS